MVGCQGNDEIDRETVSENDQWLPSVQSPSQFPQILVSSIVSKRTSPARLTVPLV